LRPTRNTTMPCTTPNPSCSGNRQRCKRQSVYDTRTLNMTHCVLTVCWKARGATEPLHHRNRKFSAVRRIAAS
jgi:hypothetical protein